MGNNYWVTIAEAACFLFVCFRCSDTKQRTNVWSHGKLERNKHKIVTAKGALEKMGLSSSTK